MKRSSTKGKKLSGPGWSLDSDDPSVTVGGASHAPPPGPPLARLRLEKRRGKPVTVAETEGLDAKEVQALGKTLKMRCGSGGTTQGSSVELQGDHRDTLRLVLPEKGIRVKG